MNREIERLRLGVTPSVKESFHLQRKLSRMVIRIPGPADIGTVAGADIAIRTKERKLICGIILFSYPEMKEIERVWTVSDEVFPYVPGLLGFREAPAVIKTFKKLKNRCDMLMVDGHGLAHPRKFGLACHVGVLLDIPAIGVAKKNLYGTFEEVGPARGERTPVIGEGGDVLGVVLRTRDGVKPVYISVGNRTDIDTAVAVVLECLRGLRIPEPTRLADKYVASLKKEAFVSWSDGIERI